jgi:hypothetical protein
LTNRNINFCFAIKLQLSGRRNSIEQKILSSTLNKKSATVPADESLLSAIRQAPSR